MLGATATKGDPARDGQAGRVLATRACLFPIAHRVDGHADAPGGRDLGQADPAADAAHVSGRILHRLGLVLSDLRRDLLFGSGIDPGPVDLRHQRPLQPVAEDLDHRLVIP
jgi:hypothetical protein